tara:strand:- start:729 stop:1328 length:600 start_codon:yes stop_codon:yes gene_type:complete
MNFLPNAELFLLSRKKLVKKSTVDLFEGKDILLIGINGAFTPTDTEMVKAFEKEYDTFLKETIVDEIHFVAMNDPYVMDAWWKSMKIKKCKYLPDGNGALVMRIDHQGGMSGGLTVIEMYNKGMGKRAWRFALLLENNCQMTYLEEETPDNAGTRDNLPDDPYILTTPELVLEHLKNRDQVSHIDEVNKTSLDLSIPVK